MSMAQAAIRWILDQEGAHTICMGAKNVEDYRAAINAAEAPPLAEAIRAQLESLETVL